MQPILDEIISVLGGRIKIAKTIAKSAASYAEKLKDIILKTNKGDYDILYQSFGAVDQFVNDLPGSGRAEGILPTVAALYDRLRLLDTAVKNIVDVISTELYNRMSIYDMSTTFVRDRREALDVIINQEEQYREVSIQDDEVIFSGIFKKYPPKNHELEIFNFVIDVKNINKFTIKLIGQLMTVVGHEKRKRLSVILDKQKDDILGASRINIQDHKGIQGLLVRYGLAPITLSMPLEQIFAAAGLKYRSGISRAENFKQAAEGGPGIILLNRSTSSPIEFNLRGMIDMDYIIANNIKTNPNDGLNKKIISRFGTAKMLPKSKAGSAPMEIYPGKNTEWIIFETINGGGLIRQLGRDGNSVLPAAGFLNGVSGRAHQYNEIQSQQITKKCFDEKAQSILQTYSSKAIASTSTIRSTIVAELSQHFGRQYDIKPVHNITQLRAIMVDREAVDKILLQTLTHSTGVHGKGSTEYLVTYISKMDLIISAFVKELDRLWSAEKIGERVFTENSTSNLRIILLQIFTNIVTAAVDKLDQSGHWAGYDISLKEFFLEKKQVII